LENQAIDPPMNKSRRLLGEGGPCGNPLFLPYSTSLREITSSPHPTQPLFLILVDIYQLFLFVFIWVQIFTRPKNPPWVWYHFTHDRIGFYFDENNFCQPECSNFFVFFQTNIRPAVAEINSREWLTYKGQRSLGKALASLFLPAAA
jgi:hypothetical protein